MQHLHYTKNYPTFLVEFIWEKLKAVCIGDCKVTDKFTLFKFLCKFTLFKFTVGKFTLCMAIVLCLSTSWANNISLGYAGLEPDELHLAESVVLKRMETNPNNDQLQIDLAFIQYYLGNLEAALESFQLLSAQENLHDNPSIFYGLALTQHSRNQPQASLKNIVTAYNLAPENYEIVKLYADISHAMNLHQATLKAYDTQDTVNVVLPEVETEDDQEIQFTFKNALKAYKANNLVASRQQLEALLGDRPDDFDAMVLLAFVMYREGDTEEAEAIFADLANRENFDENSDVLYGLALSQRNLGKEVEAFENVLRAIVAATTREDLLALYRSLALQLSKEAEAKVQTDNSDTSTESNSPKDSDELSSDELSLKDVIADISESEKLNQKP